MSPSQWGHLIQQSARQSSYSESRDCPANHSTQRQRQPASYQQPHYTPWLCTQCDTHTDISCALRHRKGHHSVNSQHGQNQCGCCEYNQQQHVETLLRYGCGKNVLHTPKIGGGNSSIKAFDFPSDARSQHSWVRLAAHSPMHGVRHVAHPTVRHLLDRNVDIRCRCCIQREVLDIARDADDFNLRWIRLAIVDLNVCANRILLAPKPLCQRLTDDCHLARFCG